MSDERRQIDAEIVNRCRAGDLTAFEELYREHSARLYNVAYRMVGHPDEAEDLLQDIFLTVFRKLDSFRGASALSTWLYRLAMNVCLDRLRSRTVKQDQRTDALDETLMPATRGGLSHVGRLDLERAIRALPEGSRAAFVLHDVEGFDHQEVGQILGIAEGTSKSQVHKARLRIRAYLHRVQDGERGPKPAPGNVPVSGGDTRRPA
jgi:RNA polymerase sigma-70 factor (ECF subfamily)